MELPDFLLGDAVGCPSFEECGSSTLLVGVESVELSLPTGLWCLAAGETVVVDDADEIVELLAAGETVVVVGAHGEGASVALHGWSS